jgi:hypothetical protein
MDALIGSHLRVLVGTEDTTPHAHNVIHEKVSHELETQAHGYHGWINVMEVVGAFLDWIEVNVRSASASRVYTAPAPVLALDYASE